MYLVDLCISYIAMVISPTEYLDGELCFLVCQSIAFIGLYQMLLLAFEKDVFIVDDYVLARLFSKFLQPGIDLQCFGVSLGDGKHLATTCFPVSRA